MDRVKKNRTVAFLISVFQGIIIGISGILPGISGGVLCILFGVYKPFVEILASPLRGIKEHWRRLLPVGIGAACGFFTLVKAVSTLVSKNGELTAAVFAGLILGTLPSLIKAAGRARRTFGSYIALLLSLALFFTLFLFLRLSDGFYVEPSFLWFLISGAIFGISIVLPGLSSSAILIFLGLLGPIADGAASLDVTVLLPLALGTIGSLVLFSRLVNTLYERHFSVMSHITVGIVIATTLPIIPTCFGSMADAFLKISLLLTGFCIAVLFERFSISVSKSE